MSTKVHVQTPLLDHMLEMTKKKHTQVVGEWLDWLMSEEGLIFVELKHWARCSPRPATFNHHSSPAQWVGSWVASTGACLTQPERDAIIEFIEHQFFTGEPRIVVSMNALENANEYPFSHNVQDWIAEWLDIDLQQVEEERTRLLEDIQETHRMQERWTKAKELRA